jgi:glycosyltransferase involved in cell wall biosynthesis
MTLKVCLISMEIFAWGKHGGYGRATRLLGRELGRRGVAVSAVVPRRGNQQPVEQLDGIRVLGFPARAPWQAADLLRQCDADVYHSQEPSLATYLAQSVMPERKHVVTCRDTRELTDWLIELRYPSLHYLQVLANSLYEDNGLVARSVRRADRVYTAAEFIGPKAKRRYRLPVTPRLLPTPVAVPQQVRKADRPTVCFLSRWDRRKRPELFLALARRFPQVRFLALGDSRDRKYGDQLRLRYAGLSNLEMPGHVDQFGSAGVSDVLSESWILVNTSVREGLPNAFLEAAAHGCAILSAVDPDGFATRFGVQVRHHDFAAGLAELLEGDRWRERGEQARRFVLGTFELNAAVNAHLAVYRELAPAASA